MHLLTYLSAVRRVKSQGGQIIKKRSHTMKTKIVISTIVPFPIAFLLAPPDLMAEIMLGVTASLLCAIPLLILARCSFVKSSSNSIHTLVCILVCLVSILCLMSYVWHARANLLRQKLATVSEQIEPG